MTYEPRTYRRAVRAAGLVTFEVALRETDLQISAVRDLRDEAAVLVRAVRDDLEHYIVLHPRFAESYVPVDVEPGAPAVVLAMARAAQTTGVGPMAAVAGAVAEHVARGLAPLSDEVVVENGGDLYLMGSAARTVALWAGDSPLSGTVGIEIAGGALPLGVCTSSGRIGPSVSFGRAHTMTVLAADGALADAAATALGNRVREAADIDAALAAAREIPGVTGVVVVLGEHIGAWGDVRLVPLLG